VRFLDIINAISLSSLIKFPFCKILDFGFELRV